MTKDINEEWLIHFRKPGYTEMKRVANILKESKIYKYKGKVNSISAVDIENLTEFDDNVPIKGTFEEISAILSEKLEEDFAENSVEQKYSPWNFDYVVTNNISTRRGAVSIWTRIYNPRNKNTGSSLYGLHVMRVSEDNYLIWIDY